MSSHLTVLTINKTDGTSLGDINPGALNTTYTSLVLPGQNYPNYGELMNENLVHMLENFANLTQPTINLTGQLWFDTTNTLLKVFDGANYVIPNLTYLSSLYVLKIGDTMSGTLNLPTLSGLGVGDLTVTSGHTAGNILFGINGTEKVRIDTVGNVGIGDTNPARQLTVTNAGNSIALLKAGNTSDSTIFFGDTDSTTVGEITYAHNVNAFKFFTNATERMRIDSSGHIAINSTGTVNLSGMSSNNTILTLVSTSSSYGSLIELSSSATALDDQMLGRLSFFDGTNHNATINVARSTSTDSAYIGFSTKPASGSLAERMRIDSLGNIAMGTTPVLNFGTITNGMQIKGSGVYQGLRLESTAGGLGALELYAGNGAAFIDGRGFDMIFSQSSEKMRMSAAGNLGIGTMPSYKLDVNSGSAATALRLTSTNTSTNIMFVDSGTTLGNVYVESGSNGLRLGAGGTTRLTVNSVGQIVLSKTGGADIVHANTNDSLHLSGSNSTTAGANVILYGNAHATNANQLQIRTDSTTRITMLSDGKVGLGVPTPSYPLQVNGLTASSRFYTTSLSTSAQPGYTFFGGAGLYSPNSSTVAMNTGGFATIATISDTEAKVPAVYSSTTGSVANVYVDSTGKLYRSTSPSTPTRTWANVTGSRSSGITYANSSGNEKLVMITHSGNPPHADIYVDGVIIGVSAGASAGEQNCFSFEVPNGSTYKIVETGAIQYWMELS